MKLKTMLLVVFFVFTVIPLLVLGIVTMNFYSSQMEDVLENDLSVATLTQVETINNFLHERNISISIISDNPSVRRLLQSPKDQDKGFVDDILDSRVLLNEYIKSVSILDKHFNIVSSSVADAEGMVSELKDIDPKLLDGAIHFSGVIESNISGRDERVILAIKGIYKNHILLGYLVEEINLSFFEKVRIAVTLFNNGTIYLLDGKRSLITAGSGTDTRTEFVLSPKEQDGYKRAWEERDRDAGKGILRYKAQGERYLSYYSDFKDTDWQMISSINVDQVLHTKAMYRRILLALCLILLLLSLTIRKLIAAKIAKPLDNIIQRFQRIKDTHDYSIRMDSPRSREIDIISSEINSLLANVESNINKEKLKQKRLKEKASTDALTGLYNKRAIEEILCSALDNSYLEKKKVSCLFIDVDDFKEYNTRYGHAGGDRVLRFVADTLKNHCPNTGRMGGDEFVVCLSGISTVQEVQQTAAQLIKALEKGVILEEGRNPVHVHCSVGVVFTEGEQHSCEELLRLADKAMYSVKNASKNDFCIVELE